MLGNLFNTMLGARAGGSLFDDYALAKYGYQTPAMGSPEEFANFDRAEFDRITPAGMQVAPELTWQQKLGLSMQPGSSAPWVKMGMGQASPQPLPNPMGVIQGLMGPAMAGSGQRPYAPEVPPQMPMPDYVQRLMQRGLMG